MLRTNQTSCLKETGSKAQSVTNANLSPAQVFLVAAAAALLLFLCFTLPAMAQAKTVPNKSSTLNLSLEPDSDDTPDLARLKAAFRLMSAYSQVQQICEKCSSPRVMKGFHSTNGTVLPKIVSVIKKSGALNDAWKAAVDDYTNKAVEQALAENDCSNLLELIKNDHWDLFQGRLLDDYKLINPK
ncbi:MAG: hypothetical protein LBE80_10565 [Deltaproteobacteria bacterium]|jgi:hypothetical protein|nr:hypothetical protein [Deltaproteobacteria bacterium]